MVNNELKQLLKELQFLKEYPEVAAKSFAILAVWLELKIKLPKDEIIRILMQAQENIFDNVMAYLNKQKEGV